MVTAIVGAGGRDNGKYIPELFTFSQWRKELQRRVKWADIVVVVVTIGSNNSDHVYDEVKLASDLGKTIVPVQVQDTELPVHLRGTWQAVKFENDNYSNILLQIERTLKETHVPNRVSRYVFPSIAVVAIAIVAVLIVAILVPQLADSDSNDASLVENTDEPSILQVTETETLQPTTTEPTITFTPEAIAVSPTVMARPSRTPTFTPVPGTELFFEDFEDGVAENFQLEWGPENWRVTDSIEEDETGNHVYVIDATRYSGYTAISFGSTVWTDYEVEYDLRIVEFPGGAITLSFRRRPIGNAYIHEIWFHNKIAFDILENNESIGVEEFNFYWEPGIWYIFKVAVKGSHIEFYINNEMVYETDDELFGHGEIMFQVGPGIHVEYDNFRVTAISD
jgi:hypothetical protein